MYAERAQWPFPSHLLLWQTINQKVKRNRAIFASIFICKLWLLLCTTLILMGRWPDCRWLCSMFNILRVASRSRFHRLLLFSILHTSFSQRSSPWQITVSSRGILGLRRRGFSISLKRTHRSLLAERAHRGGPKLVNQKYNNDKFSRWVSESSSTHGYMEFGVWRAFLQVVGKVIKNRQRVFSFSNCCRLCSL